MDTKNNRDKKEEIIDTQQNDIPSIEVNHNGNIFSNFISNFKKQFNKAKGLGLGKLFGKKAKAADKKITEAHNIMGPTKSLLNLEIKITSENSSHIDEKPSKQLNKTFNNKRQDCLPNNKKSKLRL